MFGAAVNIRIGDRISKLKNILKSANTMSQ